MTKSKAARDVGVDSSVHMYCECLADPENSQACRMPDAFVSGTVAQKLVNEYVISTDSAGNFVDCVSTSLARSRYTTPISAGVLGTATFTAHPDYTEVLGAFTVGRLVTYQVTVTYIGATQTGSGKIGIIGDHGVNTYLTGAVFEGMFDDGWSGPAIEGAFHRVRPSHPPEMESINGAAAGGLSHEVTWIIGQGLPPSTACLNVRVTRHMEFVPQKDSVWKGSTKFEPYNPLVMAAAANMAPAGVVGAAHERVKHASWARKAALAAWRYLKPELSAMGGAAVTAATNEAKISLLALLGG